MIIIKINNPIDKDVWWELYNSLGSIPGRLYYKEEPTVDSMKERARKAKIYYEKNKEKINKQNREKYRNSKMIPMTEEEIRIKRAEYYQKKKEKIKQSSKEYYEANKAEVDEKNRLRAKMKRRYENDKENMKQTSRDYYEENKELVKQKSREIYYPENKEKYKELREPKREELNEYAREYYKLNKETINAKNTINNNNKYQNDPVFRKKSSDYSKLRYKNKKKGKLD